MSLGNGNPREGDKGSNFDFERSSLKLLQAIADATAGGGVIPTTASVPIVVGGSLNTGWGINEVLILGIGIDGTLISGGTGGSTYNSTVDTDFRKYFLNTQKLYSGTLLYDLQITLTGTISDDQVQFALGKATATTDANVYTFNYTLGSTLHTISTNVGRASYIFGSVPYTSANNDILIFGLLNPDRSRAITNSTVHITGTITLTTALA